MKNGIEGVEGIKGVKEIEVIKITIQLFQYSSVSTYLYVNQKNNKRL